jgi:hypothetical protein
MMSIVSNEYSEFNNTFGTIVNYICSPGYAMINGNNKRTCNEMSLWTGQDIVCEGNLNSKFCKFLNLINF